MSRKSSTIFVLVLVMLITLSMSMKVLADDKGSNNGNNINSKVNDNVDKKEFNTVKAEVTKILVDNTKDEKVDGSNNMRYQEFTVKILEGKHLNEEYNMRNIIDAVDVYNLYVSPGDKILLDISEDSDGKITNLHLFDMLRENYLYWVIGLFFVLLVLIGRGKGLKSIVTLLFTALMVIKVLLPLILKGYSPIMTSILVCTLIVAATLLIVSGFNKKTLTAFIGTIGGIIVSGTLALIVGNAAKVTGLANEDAQMLAYLPQKLNLDFKGILFAGIIIGCLGAVMDVTMSMASAMHEIREIKPDITKKELIKSGMNIGKDIMGLMSNTLILAQVGASIQLMLLFMAAKTSIHQIINLDMIASEIIRAVVGSIGLVCAIPLTAIVAATITNKNIGKQLLITTKQIDIVHMNLSENKELIKPDATQISEGKSKIKNRSGNKSKINKDKGTRRK